MEVPEGVPGGGQKGDEEEERAAAAACVGAWEEPAGLRVPGAGGAHQAVRLV